MEEDAILITQLNDFVFCPVSIYFHNLYGDTDKTMYQSESQINGTAAHEKVDTQKYSTRTDILQGIYVFSEEYGLVGKIDLFDNRTGILTERKRTIKQIYDGYIFQLYGQYFGLCEMGYKVEKIRIHSMTDNKIFVIPLPEEDKDMFQKFKNIIDDIRNFNIESFTQTNSEKCKHCIYEPACDRGVM